MAKELIISANVHEKKVAIIEDGVVTEFYVERRDENQGVVGNLYKGRVMKVLPGMQSAFVNIGLERDAFLYVSDFTEFMEEDDEIDFKESADDGRAPAPRAEERPRRPDRQRTPIAQVAMSGAEPAFVERHPDKSVHIEDVVEQLAEIADESVIPPPPTDEDLDEESVEADSAIDGEEEEIAEASVASLDEIFDAPSIPQVVYERVADEFHPEEPARYSRTAEELEPQPPEGEAQPAEEEGQLLEEAQPADERPKRSRSRKKAAEPEPPKTSRRKKKSDEPEASANVESGRRKGKATTRRAPRRAAEANAAESAPATATGPQFERVTDEDVAVDAGDLLKDAIVQEKISEQVHSAEYQTGPLQIEPEPEWRVGSYRSRIPEDAGFQRVVDETSESQGAGASDQAALGSGSGDGDEQPDEESAGASAQPFRHISEILPAGLSSGVAEIDAPERLEASDGAAEGHVAEEGEAAGEVAAEPAADERAAGDTQGEDEIEEGEAGIRDRGSRAEFAIRRGGRGRRRRREPPAGGAAVAVEDEKGVPSAKEDGGEETGEVQKAAEPSKPVAQRMPDTRPDRRSDQQRRPETRRPEPAPARRPDKGGPPTISELLHEGQEILVQIAKEPIAKKGARITSHIALPGRLLVYMPTVNHVGVSRKIASEAERVRLKRTVSALRDREAATGGFIARTACAGHSEQELHDDMRYLLRTWADVRKKADRSKSPSLVHRDLDLVQRILRDQLSDEYSAIRVDNEVEYARIVEFVNRVQPKLVNRVKLYVGNQPILEKYSVQPEIDKAVRPRVWLRSGGYIVINQTEALVAIDVNTGKFVGKSDRLEDTITRTNLEAAKEIVRQIRLRDLGGIIVIDFIDMEERKNRQRVMTALQQELGTDRAPSKILSINDFGLVAITRKRVKQSLERTLCTPCPYCQGAGMVKSPQTICFEILEQAKAMSRQLTGSHDVMLRVSPDVAEALHTTEGEVLEEVEAYFGTPVTIEADPHLHQEQYDFAIV